MLLRIDYIGNADLKDSKLSIDWLSLFTYAPVAARDDSNKWGTKCNKYAEQVLTNLNYVSEIKYYTFMEKVVGLSPISP